ncbi:MAG: carboxypeptidase regulatory-like domain-containing protein [Planctomycetes bacterium]|nr:carboxypeptidase regulatory-like domain-containing protein [Planctomycetota bacterium]
MSTGKHGTQSTSTAVVRTVLAAVVFALLVFAGVKFMAQPREAPQPAPFTGDTASTPSVQTNPLDTGATRDAGAVAVSSTASPSALDAPVRAAGEVLVQGVVRARGGAGIAGARVRLQWLAHGADADGAIVEIGETRSRADGSYWLSTPLLEPALGTDGLVQAVVDAPRYRPGRHQVALAQLASPATLVLDVRLEQGERVRGRVVDPSDRPVPLATVALSVAQVEGSVTKFVHVESVTTRTDGRFDLGFVSSGRYNLAARANAIGTAFVADLELEAGVEKSLPDLVLQGGEPITGRVTDESGAPVPYLELWAIDSNYANDPNALALSVSRTSNDERGDGLSTTHTTTDADGRFSLAGLRPAHYALRCSDRLVVLDPHQLRYTPGTPDVALFVHSQRLIVRVTDDTGRPIRGASVRVSDWSELPDGSHEITHTRTQTVRREIGAVAFVLEPETPVIVQAFDARRAGSEEIVILAQNEWRREITLVLPGADDRGRIQIDLRDPNGVPLGRLRASLLASVTLVPREDIGILESDEFGLLPPVPVGTYQLVVAGDSAAAQYVFPARTIDPVTVARESTTVVSLTARVGGRVRVELVLSGAEPEGFQAPANSNVKDRRERFGVRVQLRSAAGGAVRALQFRGSELGAGLVGRLLPGETLVSDDLLEAGAYALTLESGVFELVSAPDVHVTAGASTAITVQVRKR